MSTLGLGYYPSSASLLCAVVYADTLAWDKVSGMYPYSLFRSGRTNYILSKLTGVALSGGLVLSLAFSLFCLFQTIFLGAPNPTHSEVMMVLQETGLFFTYGAVWSLVGLAISSIIPNPIAATVLPFCLSQGLWFFSAIFNQPMLNSKDAIALINNTQLSFQMILIQEIIILVSATTIFSVSVYRRN